MNESSVDAMIAVSPDQYVLRWNKAASVLFGREKEQAIGRLLSDILPSTTDDHDYHDTIQWALTGKLGFLPASDILDHRRRRDTHIIPLAWNGQIIGLMLLVQDVSDRLLKEDELNRLNSELLRCSRQLNLTTHELTYLTNLATHGIRQPVRQIYVGIEHLIKTEGAAVSNNGKASFRRIQSSLNRVNLLLDDLIALTNINILEKPSQMVDANQLVRDVLVGLDKRIRETKTSVTVKPLVELRAHRDQLALMLQQFFSCAIRLNSSKQPFLEIACDKIEPQQTAPGYYELSIVHNGDGFEALDLEVLYQKIETPKQEYSGAIIAMVIANKVMEAHSGSFHVEKTPEGNTALICRFPV